MLVLTTNIDQNLHDQITSVNDTIYATEIYDERIDVQEWSDLFWRLTGITSAGGGTRNQVIHILLLVLNSLRFMINRPLVYQVFLHWAGYCWIFNQ